MESLVQFYRSTIENMLAFSICVRFGSISQRRRSRLDRVVKTASQIVASELTSLTTIYNDRTIKKKGWQYYLRPNSSRSSSFSNYYRHANVVEASVRQQIALEITRNQI